MRRIIASPLRRRDHLREYLIACIRDGDLSWMDLSNPVEVVDKMLSVFRKDITVVLKDIGRTGGAKLLSVGAAMLAGVAQNVGKQK